MVEHNWPLKDTLPAGPQHITKSELLEFLDEVADPEAPIWIDNYRQIRHQITQRPIHVLINAPDGAHIG
ncbi:hypothetical protein ACLRGF_12465 [Mycetocola zhadangensis]|uniref:hypothetical protein n=1 Tax=Mycetocola zhadangensis TaxID=1164595 RepID=UPI003A4E3C87